MAYTHTVHCLTRCFFCKVKREIFEASGGRLKVVGRAGLGTDNVDLAAATEVGKLKASPCLRIALSICSLAMINHTRILLMSCTPSAPPGDTACSMGVW